jgi:hypothetical protein
MDQLTITYGETTDVVFAKRLKLRERLKVADMQASSAGSGFRQYLFGVVLKTIVTEDGKPALTEDEMDTWGDAKFGAYATAVANFQNPKVEEAGKNSSTTATGETSSQ